MDKLTAEDCRNILTIIANAKITGADAGLVAALQNKLVAIAERAQRRQDDEASPHHGDFYNPGGTA